MSRPGRAVPGTADLLIVGGGINGAGIARDAAGRGWSVVLCEQSDLAAGTSSASTKLIHGGLRYLEHLEFRLVREALSEREVLLAMAPHIIWPMRFVLPHHRGLRPARVLRFGLFLYDHLGGRERLPGARSLNLRRHVAGAPLRDEFTKGFEYSDCWVDDARLVVLNAMDARERGAIVLTRTRLESARRTPSGWEARLAGPDGSPHRLVCRSIVNATGPWVGETLQRLGVAEGAPGLRLVKGSHVVIPRHFDGEQAYCFQGADGRVVFAIPYERRFTLVGTTEEPWEGDPAQVAISEGEIAYLCATVSDYFREPVSPRAVAWSYAGVRPLYGEGEGESASAVSRDYVLEMQPPVDAPPALHVMGGKITTYRRLAERALELLAAPLAMRVRPWTATAPLPGGDLPDADFGAFLADATRRWDWLPAGVLHRLLRAYGTRIERVLGRAVRLADLGQHFGAGLHEAEVDYLVREEWAETAEDVLWRRSKLGLHMDATQRAAVTRWFG